ncbi:hypothetical protein [Agrobacterium bohemicum]|uniref:Methanolan biosynthesis EpsI domain-containing protein n=1 Tax=Agrobacterium bohemicum TaxID=2052828 RepID=A0A135P844_9HYPH|nr:hypothetical protein [Agrobacterium bohemicum]KXG87591.1 hypothetical protein ATO67_18260 [Agrobacterium bohemicum]
MRGMRRFHPVTVLALACLSSPALADPTPVDVVIPNYEITFSELPEKIDVLGLRPGMDEETTRSVLKNAGYKYQGKEGGTDCTFPTTPFQRFKVCIEKDTGARRFTSANPLETVYLKFAPVQAGGKLLEIIRYIDYRNAKSSADIPKPEDVANALREKYPAPTTGTNFDMTKIQCWAYRNGQPVEEFAWSQTYCEGNGKVAVDVRLKLSISDRMDTVLSDLAASQQAEEKYRAFLKAATQKILEDSVSERATAPKL